MTMRVALITGSYPPDICGVADYSARLTAALEELGLQVVVISGRRWGTANALSLSRELEAIGADIVHIQYPATGYGWLLGPQVLSLLRPLVTTIHECSQTHILRRLSLYPFGIRARKIIFTNRFEQNYSLKFAPWIRKRSTVIPIGTNVLPQREVFRLPNVVTYFGLIRPRKGLEDVIQLARLFKQRANGLSVRIVGNRFPGAEDYYTQLHQAAAGLPLQWVLGLNGIELSQALAQAAVAYLPFPDGASERRSSLIAMLSNETAVITTRGPHTPPAMEQAVQIAMSPTQAATIAEDMFKHRKYLEANQAVAKDYAASFAWSSIAARHLEIYQQLTAQEA